MKHRHVNISHKLSPEPGPYYLVVTDHPWLTYALGRALESGFCGCCGLGLWARWVLPARLRFKILDLGFRLMERGEIEVARVEVDEATAIAMVPSIGWDLEDGDIAAERLAAIEAGEGTVPAEEVYRDLGLTEVYIRSSDWTSSQEGAWSTLDGAKGDIEGWYETEAGWETHPHSGYYIERVGVRDD